MTQKPNTYKENPEEKGLGNPLAIAGLALSGLTAKDQIMDLLKKYWPWMLGLVAVSVGGYMFYKKIKDPNIALKQDNSQEKSKLSKLEAQNIAETLFKAMYNPGTDENTILDVLNGKTYNDFVKISEAFGKRYYDKTLGIEGGWLFNDEYGLFEWLSFELSNSDMLKLQKVIPAIFKIEKTLRVGGNAIAKKEFVANKAELIDNVWHKKGVEKPYRKNDKLGRVVLIINDPFQKNKQYAIIDKPWNPFYHIWVDVDNIEA